VSTSSDNPPPTLEQRVLRVIESSRPYIRSHGGDVEFLGVDERNRARVRLRGACAGCPGSLYTLQMGIEREVLAQVPEIRAVVAVP
jgi:Fe-S cluster biogenesis protein NfuA